MHMQTKKIIYLAHSRKELPGIKHVFLMFLLVWCMCVCVCEIVFTVVYVNMQNIP